MKKNEIVRLGTILFVITLITALLLGSVNALTAPVIEQRKLDNLNNAIRDMFPDAANTQEESVEGRGLDPAVLKMYIAKDASGNKLGTAVSVAPGGFAGPIDMMVGVDIDGNVVAVKILDMKETPGLGTKTKEDSFLSAFSGKTSLIEVVKGSAAGNQISAISGATVSSKAVTNGVNVAVDAAKQ